MQHAYDEILCNHKNNEKEALAAGYRRDMSDTGLCNILRSKKRKNRVYVMLPLMSNEAREENKYWCFLGYA